MLLLSENIDAQKLIENIDTNSSETKFYKALIKLIGFYIGSIKEGNNLERLFTSLMIGNEIHNPVGISFLMSFLIPLLLWNSSNNIIFLHLNQLDTSFAISIILNSLKISSKAVSNLVFQLPKLHIVDLVDTSFIRFQNYQSKSIRNTKDMITQAAFLSKLYFRQPN